MLNSNYLIILGMCLVTLVIMLLIMPGLIDYLHKIKFGQTEREEGLASHKKKNGTPTMGGLAFIIVPTLVYIIGSFFTPFKLDMNTMIILLAFVGYGVDYANLGQKTADMIADILIDNADPSKTAVETFDNGTATVNTETCKALGLDFDTVKKAFEPLCTQVNEITTAESFDEVESK